MSKKCYRFFGGLLQTQERWLNKMAQRGYRLTAVGKLAYHFKECQPGKVVYKVDFIGHKSHRNAQDYHDFLEDVGYKVFYKNINLNYSIGKLKFRPWAEKGGRIATHQTTFNRELLIVEKENDGRPFELHTFWEDQTEYYRSIRNPWLTLFVMLALFAVIYGSWHFFLWALLTALPVVFYQYQIIKAKKESKVQE